MARGLRHTAPTYFVGPGIESSNGRGGFAPITPVDIAVGPNFVRNTNRKR